MTASGRSAWTSRGQPGGIRELGHHVDAFVSQQAGYPGAHEGRIVHQHHAHASLHWRMMPRIAATPLHTA